MAGENEYRLRCELRGHEEDVRGICICIDDAIATASRDKTVRYWEVDENKRNYKLSKTMVGHSSFVGTVSYIPPNQQLSGGGLVSGGMDTTLIMWDLNTCQPVHTLKGHGSQVTSVLIDQGGSGSGSQDVLSCSMDCTVKRWRNGACVESWKAHESPVQDIVKLQNGFATASSDTTVKIWEGTKLKNTLSGHLDTVRGLALMPNVGLLSCSHDGTVRLWALSGEVLMEMVGHTSLVYSVAVENSSGVVASASEDRSAKIWRDAMCLQNIEHPGCVWDVKFLPNGDLVTACSDGVTRIWTKDEARMASGSELEEFEMQVSVYKASSKSVGGVKLNELPGMEALQEPGNKDGQTKIVREGDSGVAYSWNSREYKWDKIGEVVDGPGGGGSGKPQLHGMEYDYVFDVDIGDGMPTRKLPYNHGDNPYFVADQWLLQEELPMGYREQVVEFILKNTGQSNVSNAGMFDSAFVDPYTGANAYVPGQRGGGPSVGGGSSFSFKHIPKKGMLLFDTAQYDGILKKVLEFNTKLSSEGLGLTDSEFKQITNIVSVMKQSSPNQNVGIADTDINVFAKILHSWPVDMLFPVLDLVRMAILYPNVAAFLVSAIGSGSDILLDTLRRVSAPPFVPANQLTGLRLVVNIFKQSCFKSWLLQNRNEVLDLFSQCCSSTNKNTRLGYSTLILNYSVLLIETKDEEGQLQVLSAAMEMADSQEVDLDVKFRALVAIGSLMLDGLVKRHAIDLDVGDIAKSALSSPDAKIREVGADLKNLILKA